MTSTFLRMVFWCLAAMLTASAAEACTPCATTLDVNESIKKADLVILAESTPISPDTIAHPVTSLPRTIHAKVLTVLKGKYPEQTIELQSWYGNCPYGFVFRQPQEVLFIARSKEGAYERVNTGCDQQSLPYKDGLVNGKYTLDQFSKTYIQR